MTVEQVQAFALFALVAAITPGPSNVMLTAVGANTGVLRGLPCLFGVVAGMGLMMFSVAFGLGSVVLGSSKLAAALKGCGVAFLLWLSWQLATASGGAAQAAPRPVGFVGAALFQWLNPKAWLVSVSAAGTYLAPVNATAFVQALWIGTLFAAIALPSGFVWLAAGGAMQRVLQSPRRLRAFNVSMATMLAASIVWIL